MDPEARANAKVFERLALAAPPQHGKTKLTECGLVKVIKTCHGLSHAYATYAQTVTDRVEAETRRLAEAAGIEIRGTREDWWIPETKSRIRWTSIGGSLTGDPVSGLLVVDDPFRDFAQARSQVERQRRWDWMVQVAIRRCHPGAWLVEMATRWTDDDITARMIDLWGVDYLNIQAICENGHDGTGRALGDPLWEQRPIEFLELQRQSDPVAFEGQYQGRPRKIGDALFGDATRYDELPDTRIGYRDADGADLAYSESTAADWSVLLRGRRIGDKLYLTGCIRKHEEATRFLETLQEQQRIRQCPIRWYHGGGGELGVCTLFRRDVSALRGYQASADKIVRSAGARKAWNLGNILVPGPDSPHYGPWVNALLQEVGVFSGIADAHDDQVDALSALYDELFQQQVELPRKDDQERAGRRRLAGGMGGF